MDLYQYFLKAVLFIGSAFFFVFIKSEGRIFVLFFKIKVCKSKVKSGLSVCAHSFAELGPITNSAAQKL